MKNLKQLTHGAMKQGFAIAAAFSLMGMQAAQAVAPATIGTTISPTSFEITANPGETITKSLTVTNESSASQSYTFTLNGFSSSGEEGQSAFMPSVSGDLSGWTTVTPNRLSLAPNASGAVNVIVRVPANAAPGGHYAILFASSRTGEAGAGSAIATNQMLGANILLRIAGDVVESGNVVEFSTPRARVIPGEPIDFTVRFRNTGNVHIKPQGIVEIYRGNVKVEDVSMNPEGINVLPNAVRKFVAHSTKTLPAGTYRAQLSLKYGANQTVSVPAISFVVIGETSLAAIVATILGIFVLILIAALMVNRKKPMSGKPMGRM